MVSLSNAISLQFIDILPCSWNGFQQIMTSVTDKRPWNIHGWMSFRWEVNCPPLYERCWGMQKECTGFPHLIKSSHVYHLFLLFLPCSLVKHHRTFMCPKSRLLYYLYCFIIMLLIYTEKELLFFFIEKHQLFVIDSVIHDLKISGIKLFTCY